jgi:outer membrane protein TolC
MMHLLAAVALLAQDTIPLSFPAALEQARRTNPNFVREQLQYDNSVISIDQAKANRYFPRLSMSFTTPEYVSAIRRYVDDEGRDAFTFAESRMLESELELFQPLPTGGTLRVTGTITGINRPKEEEALERYVGRSFLGFQLQQQVFGINQSIRSYRLARESFARAEAEFANEERNLARNVMDAYYGLVQAKKQAIIDSVIFVRDSMRNSPTADRPAQEPMSEVDSLKFELEAARSAFNRTRSAQSLLRARSRLNEVLALPANAVVIPDSAIRVQRFVPDVDAGLAAAYTNRQDLRLAQLAVENRTAGLRDAHRTSPITLFVNTRVGFDGSATAADADAALRTALGKQSRSKTVNLGVEIPLFDRFEERHAIGRATNDLESAEISLEDQRRRLENEVRNAAQRVNNASTGLDLAERQYAITVRTLEIQTRRFGAGEINSVEFLIDQASARQAEIGLLSAQVEMLTATEEWKRAIGERSGLTSPP